MRCRRTSSETAGPGEGGRAGRRKEGFGLRVNLCLCVCVSERLARQREILEERAERRLEIFKNLVDNLSAAGAADAAAATAAAAGATAPPVGTNREDDVMLDLSQPLRGFLQKKNSCH